MTDIPRTVPTLSCPHCGAQDEITRVGTETLCAACGRVVDDVLGNGEATHAVVFLFTSEAAARGMRALKNHDRGIVMEWPPRLAAPASAAASMSHETTSTGHVVAGRPVPLPATTGWPERPLQTAEEAAGWPVRQPGTARVIGAPSA